MLARTIRANVAVVFLLLSGVSLAQDAIDIGQLPAAARANIPLGATQADLIRFGESLPAGVSLAEGLLNASTIDEDFGFHFIVEPPNSLALPVPIPPPSIEVNGNGGRVVKIMPVGDSITAGLTNHTTQADRASYRPKLWHLMKQHPDVINGNLMIDYTGLNTQSGIGAGNGTGTNIYKTIGVDFNNDGDTNDAGEKDVNFDDDNSAVRGYVSGSFSNADKTAMWNSQPDVVLILLGTNDFINAESVFTGNGPGGTTGATQYLTQNLTAGNVNSTKANLQNLIQGFQVQNQNVTVMVGTVPELWWFDDPDFGVDTSTAPNSPRWGNPAPDNPAADGDNDGDWVQRFEVGETQTHEAKLMMINDMVKSLVSFSTATSDVIVVDHEPTIEGDPSVNWPNPYGNPGPHLIDGVHGAVVGDNILARNWYFNSAGRGLDEVLDDLVAVPEPSSFLFLGLVLAIAGGRNFWNGRKAITR